MTAKAASSRHKLGVALAGGGFRASLFHMGVLRRLAELDLLRYVEVLSTVSGGSIVGALYALLLKRRLEELSGGGRLSRDQYIALVGEAQAILIRGIQKNLRTRLFMNPLGMLRVLLTPMSLGQRMARLYERYLYRGILRELEPRSWWGRLARPGCVLLKDIRIRPGGAAIAGGIEAYNRRVVEQAIAGVAEPQRGSAITKLVLNATSLNSGARFWFSSVELGEWVLGHFREDELSVLLERRELLEEVALDELRQALSGGTDPVSIGARRHARRTVSLALWWRDCTARPPAGWEPLFQIPGFPGELPQAPLGRLRQAKLAAWYVRYGPQFGVTGGRDARELIEEFWEHIDDIDHKLAAEMRSRAQSDERLRNQLLDLVLELYWLRTATVMSRSIRRDWDRISLGDAVGASACFPPVFPPFQVLGFYDDLHVSRLGLTDGGVFDNIGFTALLDEGCTHIIASDTSGLFDVVERASIGRLGMMGRIAGILMLDVAWNQREHLAERIRVSRRITEHLATDPTDAKWAAFHVGRELHGLAFFHISSRPVEVPQGEPPALDPPLDGSLLARIRTDLDGFGDVEAAALVNHGYVMADRYVRCYMKDSPYRDARCWDRPPALPLPMPVTPRVHEIVTAAQSRFGRALRLGAPVSWAFVAFSAGLLTAAIWSVRDEPISVAAAFDWLARRASAAVGSLLPWFGPDWVTHTWPIGAVTLALLGLLGAWVVWRLLRLKPVDWLARRGVRAWARRLAWLAKWARGTAGNLLWVLGGAPLWIAFASAVAASVSYVFFHLPFLSATRRKT